MIPISQIILSNLYSQEDASFLLGEGFTVKAAREAICEACRSGQLPNKVWRKRFWFTGRAFLKWVQQWFGEEVDLRETDTGTAVAHVVSMQHNDGRRFRARSPKSRKEVDR